MNRSWRGNNRAYDSKFEKDLSDTELAHCEYHPKTTYDYIIPHTYHPDFTWVGKDGITYLIEVKGFFMDSSEASKYLHLRNNLPKDVELVFLFQNPKTPMPRAKKRKDGTKASVSEWATKHNFSWFSQGSIHHLFNA